MASVPPLSHRARQAVCVVSAGMSLFLLVAAALVLGGGGDPIACVGLGAVSLSAGAVAWSYWRRLQSDAETRGSGP